MSPSDDSVRPTTDRIKETIFNILQPYVADAVVLDLFAGSGALGIECLSRGAKEVVFADKRRESIALVNQNLKGIDGSFRVIAGDFLGVLRSARQRFDLIFLDPPYNSGLGERAIETILRLDILTDDGIIIYEHAANEPFNCDKFDVKSRAKEMGYVTVDFIRRKSVAMMAGSFDLFTNGHLQLLKKAAEDFDKVVVACLINPDKEYLFTPEQRLEIIRAAICGEGINAANSENSAENLYKSALSAVSENGIAQEANAVNSKNSADNSYQSAVNAVGKKDRAEMKRDESADGGGAANDNYLNGSSMHFCARLGECEIGVIYSENTAVDTAKQVGAQMLVRGVRNEKDAAYEWEMAAYNEARGISTVIYELAEKTDVSSSSVKQKLLDGDYSEIPAGAEDTVKRIMSKQKTAEN